MRINGVNMLEIDFDDSFIEKLASVICGDDYYDKFCEDSYTKCPVYRTKPQLKTFFKNIVDFESDNGESRTKFTIQCLSEANRLNKMDIVLKKLSNPKTYRDEKIIQFIINEINGIIMWDDIEIKLENNQPKIVKSDESVSVNISNEKSNDFISLDFKQLIDDETLSEIMNKRWLEIKQTYASQSYLSTVVLLGSILEGLLYYYVSTNYNTVKSTSSSPKDSSGEIIPFDNWKLNDLINVAHECTWLDDDIKTFNEGLRDYRNLIHPKVQNDKLIIPDKDTCDICIDVVVAAFNDLKDKEYLK